MDEFPLDPRKGQVAQALPTPTQEELRTLWIKHRRNHTAGGGPADAAVADDAADDDDAGLGCYLPDDALDNLDAEGKFLQAEDAPPSPMDLEDL